MGYFPVQVIEVSRAAARGQRRKRQPYRVQDESVPVRRLHMDKTLCVWRLFSCELVSRSMDLSPKGKSGPPPVAKVLVHRQQLT